MKKEHKETNMDRLVHGRDSKTIKALQEKLRMMPLKDVDKMRFERYLDHLEAKNFAFEIDSHIKMHLIEAIQSTDKKLMSYQADLANSQMKLADLEQKVQFHEKVRDDLQMQYLNEGDPTIKASIYERIQEAEKSIILFERSVKDYLELRNKIRKEIDKGKYIKKGHELKEQQMKDSGSMAKQVIDFDIMEDVE